MDREQVLRMDGFMLLSIINMKLRDEFDSLQSLCEDFDLCEKEVLSRLKAHGYIYSPEINQFIIE